MSSRYVAVIRGVVAAALAVTAGAVFVPGSASAATLPGDKANYVVAMGHLADNFRGNWVRLGTYEFKTTGTVTARMWLWSQTSPVSRVGTGTTPDSSCSTTSGSSTSRVRTCEILTAGGFTSTAPETRTGTFTTSTQTVGGVPTQVVSISWQVSGAWTDEWYVRKDAGGLLSRLDFKYNTKALYGYGYGSNAALTTRRAMSSVVAFPGTLQLDQYGWSKDNVAYSDGVFQHTSFRTCDVTTHCITYVQPSSSRACQNDGGCPEYGGGTGPNVTSIQYYISKMSSYDRRDSLWHWCTCLAMEQGRFCYTGNSHVKPMLQIIDDTGAFRGWVGVEASFYPRDTSEYRDRDMISVFRLSDFR
ncbi:hypothetical protein [Allorhizocola rhizosphaerae]|uniref:hypothetical protein n=1 Tax=Allorhizocola rhizosphaerae TaxID=1872709 RepID=UPI0013C350B7|nr:hypothetical protein [Allorhizocola rhizosphaerae]